MNLELESDVPLVDAELGALRRNLHALERELAERTARLLWINCRLEKEVRDRKRAEAVLRKQGARLRLLQEAAAAANLARSIEEAIQICIDLVCRHTGWPVGRAFLRVIGGPEALVPVDVWHFDEATELECLREIDDPRWVQGIGLPARALSSREPVWVPDARREIGIVRHRAVADLGVIAGCAIPVVVDGEVAAVLEFFSRRSEPPSEELLQVLTYVAVQLARVVDRHRGENALRDSEARFKDFSESAADFFWELDSELRLTFVSDRFESITGLRASDIVSRSLEDTLAPFAIGSSQWAIARHAFRRRVPCRLEYAFPRTGGKKIWVRMTGRPMFDERGWFRGYRGAGTDISQERARAERLSYQASHDGLTDLVNRREFERRLARALSSARARNARHALCYLDLDRFKQVNDVCGHAGGDALLCRLAELFGSKIRRRDTLARLGGDEFAILMENCAIEEAVRVAESLRELVQTFEFAWGSKRMKIGVSIGLTRVDASCASIEAAMEAADTACYAAKSVGRSRVSVA